MTRRSAPQSPAATAAAPAAAAAAESRAAAVSRGAARAPAIAFRGVTVRYGQRQALRNLCLAIEPGQFVLVTGPSGCGKSTLALAACGLIPHAHAAEIEGSVSVFGSDTRSRPVHALAGEVGMVFQNPSAQLFHGLVEEEVAFAPHNLGLSADEIAGRVASALSSVGITHLAGRQTQSLSAGEKQRLAVAAALSLKPRLLVLDEPTANLDWQGVELLVNALRRLHREQGLTVLVIEHRLSAFCPVAERVLILKEGHPVADGPPEEVFAARRRLVELGLRFPRPHVRDALRHYLPEGIDAAERTVPPLVALQGIYAGYGGRRARPVLPDLSFALYPGEFAALVGPNGTGKSTVARVLAGMLRPQRGRVLWNPSLRHLPLGRRVGFLFQNAAGQLLMDTVAEEVAFAPSNLGLDVERCSHLALTSAGLQGLRGRFTGSLSLGEQQRTALAAVLAAAPALLILDEPTIGQDWGHLERLMDHLRGLTRRGIAVLLITHDDKLVCRFADRVLCLEEGRLAADGPPRQLEQQRGENREVIGA